MSIAATRSTGASRCSNWCSAMRAAISPPNPAVSVSSWAMTMRLVSRTAVPIVSQSHGVIVRSQAFRTLFLQEILKRGIIAPSFVVSAAHSDADIARTIDAVAEALVVYRQAIEAGVEKFLVGRPVQPVFRKFN